MSNDLAMKWNFLTALAASLALATVAAEAKMPSAKSAALVSGFGNAPLNETQLKALNEILEVGVYSPPAEPAPAPPKTSPSTTSRPSKPSKLKPSKKEEPDKARKDDDTRIIDYIDESDRTISVTIDPSAGVLKNVRVPTAQAGAVKNLLTSLNLGKK